MASFTFLPEGCFVFVILFMTTNTGKRRILECRRQVTLLAFDLYVATCQGKTGLVVIEGCVFPFFLVVTAFALVTELAFMLVVLLVAGDARILQLAFVDIAFLWQMAGITLGLSVLCLEGILGFLVVVKDAGLPVFSGVTTSTFIAIATLVAFFLVILAVTGYTLHLQLKFLGLWTADPPFVTGFALGILVFIS